jgi:hypothetical protein
MLAKRIIPTASSDGAHDFSGQTSRVYTFQMRGLADVWGRIVSCGRFAIGLAPDNPALAEFARLFALPCRRTVVLADTHRTTSSEFTLIPRSPAPSACRSCGTSWSSDAS